MKKIHFHQVHWAIAAAAAGALFLSACGGGSATSPAVAATAATASVPIQASTSVAALISWALTDARSDTNEPLDTDAFHPPVDDRAEPTAVN